MVAYSFNSGSGSLHDIRKIRFILHNRGMMIMHVCGKGDGNITLMALTAYSFAVEEIKSGSIYDNLLLA